jgi:putative DNA primase/helicase
MSVPDLAFEKGLPANPDAERFVLGSTLLNDGVWDEYIAVLDVDDFSLEKHRRIFGRMQDLRDRGEHIDRVTLSNELIKQGQLESVDGLSYLSSLDEGLPALVNLDGYVRIIREKSLLRKLIFGSQKVVNRCLLQEDNGIDIIAGHIEQVEELRSRHENGGWPELQPVLGTLPPVMPFRADLLPDALRALVVDTAARMQVPMDLPAVMSVLNLAGVVNRRAAIQPKKRDTGWIEVPNLWGGIVGPPGVMLKSPTIAAITKPLELIQADWRREHEEAQTRYERDLEEFEIRLQTWKEQYKAHLKSPSKPVGERPEDHPQAPKLKRLTGTDATFEALHKLMNENPAGLYVIRDELAGWFSSLDKIGREPERAFFLESWNGNKSFTVDRIERGSVHVEACCLSMAGGIQPARLRQYLVDAVEDGAGNDGLIQRFQLLVWPDLSGWQYTDFEPDAEASRQAERVYRALVKLDPANPAIFHFAGDAQAFFVSWLTRLEGKIRGGNLHPALVSHLSKYRSLMVSLALLFELADRVGFEGFESNFVTLEHARQAADWCEYLESHARRVYSCIVSPAIQAANDLAKRIRTRQVTKGRFFTLREIYQKGWTGMSSPTEARQACQVLTDLGWIRQSAERKSGRPSGRFEINPEVMRGGFGGFAGSPP